MTLSDQSAHARGTTAAPIYHSNRIYRAGDSAVTIRTPTRRRSDNRVMITDRPDRGAGPDVGEAFAAADRRKWTGGVAVTTQTLKSGSARPAGHLDRVEDHVGAHVPGDAPPDDHPRAGVHDEADVGHGGPGCRPGRSTAGSFGAVSVALPRLLTATRPVDRVVPASKTRGREPRLLRLHKLLPPPDSR